MLLGWIGEKIAGAELFAKYSKTSPFLMEDFHTYFQGTHKMKITGHSVEMTTRQDKKCDSFNLLLSS